MTAADALEKELQDAVREAAERSAGLRPVAGGTKSALAPAADDPRRLPVEGLRGVVEYEPAEYTVTVRAGTPIGELQELLAAQGQHLPFDPPLGELGATVGGTIAAGLSGPGRFRYGGVRDFLLGIRFVDGRGEVHAGGGRVVKNAAGFDLPKLMVGALGRLGVLTEATFKVFPAPEAHATLTVDAASPAAAWRALQELGRSPLELACLELEPPARLIVRLGGAAEALEARLDRVRGVLGGDGAVARGDADARIWRDAASFAWVPSGHALVKVPLTPPHAGDLEEALSRAEDAIGVGVPRRYSAGGSVAWLAWPEDRGSDRLRALLAGRSLAGLVVRGTVFRLGGADSRLGAADPRVGATDSHPNGADPRLGPRPGGAFLERIASVLDPHGVFDPDRGAGPSSGRSVGPGPERGAGPGPRPGPDGSRRAA